MSFLDAIFTNTVELSVTLVSEVERVFRLPNVASHAFVRRPCFLLLFYAVFATRTLVLTIPLSQVELWFEDEETTQKAELMGRIFFFHGFPVYFLSSQCLQ